VTTGFDCTVIVRHGAERPRWFLERTLQSIGGQSLLPAEVIVVRDGADAGAWWPPSFVSSRVQPPAVISLPIRSGPGSAANAGLRAATTRWCVLLDDDDTWSSDFLLEMSRALEREADAGGVVCGAVEILEHWDGHGCVTHLCRPFLPWSGVVDLWELAWGNTFTTNSFVFDRAKALQLGGYRTDLPVLEDWDFHLRFALAYRLIGIPPRLAYYHRRIEASGVGANTSLALHQATRERLRVEWLARDLAAQRIGPGFMTMLAQIRRSTWRARSRRIVARLRRLVFGDESVP
jgi:glycosyltransferase involved in cell wall biosynthesis